MIWPHVAAKSLREVLRQPVAAATVVGLPLVMMVVFGAVLPDHVPSSAAPDKGLAAEAAGGIAGNKSASLLPLPVIGTPAKPSTTTTTPPATSNTSPWPNWGPAPPRSSSSSSTSTPTAPSASPPALSSDGTTGTQALWWQRTQWWTGGGR